MPKTLILFPFRPFIWWYTQGLLHIATFTVSDIKHQWKKIGLSILIKNLTQPLYGVNGKWDYVISVGVRIGHLIAMVTIFSIISISTILLLLFWIVFPAIPLTGLYSQIS